MRSDSLQGVKISGCLIGIILSIARVQAQDSVYDKITGIVPYISDYVEESSESPHLTAKLKARYDDILKTTNQEEQLEFARWSYGASVDWRVSKKQSWHFEMFRAVNIVRASRLDSSWEFKNLQKINRFKMTHRRALGKLPVSILSYFQIYNESKKTLFNYGIGLQGAINNYTFGFESEYKNWSPFYQVILNDNIYNVELYFPTLANIRQIKWSLAGNFKNIYFQSYITTGNLVSSNRDEQEYTFRPSAEVHTLMGLLQKKLNSTSQVKLSFFLHRITGDGILRFRDRKYGNLHLQSFHFIEARLSTSHWFRKTFFDAGVAYQMLSGHANANIQAWPFDNSGIDFFKAKQSIIGTGNLSLIRSWIQAPLTFSNKFQIKLFAEYINARTQAQIETWGTALVFGNGQFKKYDFASAQAFIRLCISPKLILSKKLVIDIQFSQWIPISKKPDISLKARGGTFGQVVLGYYL